MHQRFIAASAIAVVLTAALLTGSGAKSSAAVVRGAQRVPAGLAAAIHARFGGGAIRSSSAAAALAKPWGLGQAVAISADGTTALVGAAGGSGAAYIFHVSDAASWSASDTPTATLTSGSAKGGLFGMSVALSADGTTAFVGAPGAMTGGIATGAIYVFHVSAEDAWATSSTPVAALNANHKDSLGSAPIAVSTDGATLVAGAPFRNNKIAGGGYVFHASSEDAWVSSSTPAATLTNAAQGPDAVFVGGFAVAISGDGTTALLDDFYDVPSDAGAYLYHVSSADAWTSSSTPTAILSDGDDATVDGAALAISGDGTVALVSEFGPDRKSAVNVFRASGEAARASASTPVAKLTNAAGSDFDFFGASVGLSADGTTGLVTGPGNFGYTHGRAFLFHVSSEGAWATTSTPTAALPKSGAGIWDKFGSGAPMLSADGTTALVGAPGVRFDTGAVDVFHVSDAGSWTSLPAPSAILTNSASNSCVVPKLKGLKVRAARAQLKARSCRLGKVTRVKASTKKARGHIVFQGMKPGSRPPIGTKVAVKVGK